MVFHNSHPWDGSRLQTVDNCWSHKQDLLYILGVHHADLHLQVHHSLLHLHHMDSQECSISCHQNYVLYIAVLKIVKPNLDLNHRKQAEEKLKSHQRKDEG